MAPRTQSVRGAPRLIGLILGDQLDHQSPLFAKINPEVDSLVMIESSHEAKTVWSHKVRIALFFSAMRHFADDIKKKKHTLEYIKTNEALVEALRVHLKAQAASELIAVEPGDYRVQQEIEQMCQAEKIVCTWLEDTHFYCTKSEFSVWAEQKKELRLEFFYRMMRKKHDVLMEDGEPLGGRWNFDDENRKPYSKKGPGLIPPPLLIEPDAITQEVIQEVQDKFKDHPGELKDFAWPVTRDDALLALDDFVNNRLRHFGEYQDAMWTQTPFGWHSLISAALNLKLISPQELVNKVIAEGLKQKIDLSTIEGYVRQVIGWREFIRGMYFLDMPHMAQANYFENTRALPEWYWTGQTKMACMQDTVGQTLRYGYAHHIQRLMILGNFALLAEVMPQAVADWFLAIYVDAVEWVELPNVAGMALFANGGRFTSKPYIASGAYIKRMSNYCGACLYKSEQRYGENACPFTNLYWHFLIKNKQDFNKNPRMKLMMANLNKIGEDEQKEIVLHAQSILSHINEI